MDIYDIDSIISDSSLFECFNKNIHIVNFEPDEQPVVENLLINMLNEYQRKQSGYLSYIKASITQLLLLANRHTNKCVEYNKDYINSAHKIISKATGYINNNFREDVTLEFMSNKFFVSTHYFSRIFKKSTGLTFIEYLNFVRIKEAQKLLATTKLSINEISETVGYKSNTHFGRIFKKITNIAPRDYRKLTKST